MLFDLLSYVFSGTRYRVSTLHEDASRGILRPAPQ
jgi:hypothetical protein